ncbi:pentapeptide repeat protein [Crinalium epipsammum PCC 9333]|uniref:Pentapeptide repeat protein n=1 Tax=Crinalium epipsammum PCC 9333 TaxID=1173022 RepID=K9W0H6_9CYAN|nr:pentapeptide repeat-containing protein [Crinalium epipsammum]AFZ13883.1 pentapeptide repeat protein [Crinalium epipsammum PCC 9333]
MSNLRDTRSPALPNILTNVCRGAIATATLLATIPLLPATAENLEHTRQLLSTKQCQQCDLRSAGFVMADLSSSQLQGADLTRANLSRANLAGADLTGANLSGTSLYGANLTGANLTGANLTGTDLRDAYLLNANLSNTSLSSAYVEGATGIPQNAGKPEDFYRWALTEAQGGNYQAAIEYYNQALTMNPEFAPAYLGRGLVLYRFGNEAAATQDAKIASQMFSTQKNATGYQASQNFLKGMELARQPAKKGGGSNFLNFLGSLGSLLVQFLF